MRRRREGGGLPPLPASDQDSGRPRSQQDREPRATGPFPRRWLGARSWKASARSAWRTADSPSRRRSSLAQVSATRCPQLDIPEGSTAVDMHSAGVFPAALSVISPTGLPGLPSQRRGRALPILEGSAGGLASGREPDSVMRRSLMKRWIHLLSGMAGADHPPRGPRRRYGGRPSRPSARSRRMEAARRPGEPCSTLAAWRRATERTHGCPLGLTPSRRGVRPRSG